MPRRRKDMNSSELDGCELDNIVFPEKVPMDIFRPARKEIGDTISYKEIKEY
jgi:hypothetical protein